MHLRHVILACIAVLMMAGLTGCGSKANEKPKVKKRWPTKAELALLTDAERDNYEAFRKKWGKKAKPKIPDDGKKTAKQLRKFMWQMVVPIAGTGLGMGGIPLVPLPTGADKAKMIDGAKAAIKVLVTALDRYQRHNDAYPSTAEGLGSLIKAPPQAKNWKGPYLTVKGDKLPYDPWGNRYRYKHPGAHNKQGYDLWSFGPDKREGGGDDIVNW